MEDILKIPELDLSLPKEQRFRSLFSLLGSPNGISKLLSKLNMLSDGGLSSEIKIGTLSEYIAENFRSILADISFDTNANPDTIKRILAYYKIVKSQLEKSRDHYNQHLDEAKLALVELKNNPKRFYENSLSENDSKLPPYEEWIIMMKELIEERQIENLDPLNLVSMCIREIDTALDDLEKLLGIYEDEGIGKSEIPRLKWNKSDTDLLELIVSLTEMKALDNNEKSLTRKDAIEAFSQFFQMNIKDAESKISRMVNRNDPAKFSEAILESTNGYIFRKDEE